ncbi:MAG: leucine--tRNA ligase [Deltaproteobacteria bacterium]|nr:leucine--tRNA ligase [Deltaproteobacteria bacterium]
MPYAPHAIEAKWQEYWSTRKTFRAEVDTSKPKFYVLDMFPYPSSDGLHVGHPKGYVATDAIARYKRMCGVNVLHPMGWDAFGLPAEQHAMRTGQHPRDTTQWNVAQFKRQLRALGLSYDWDRELDTTDPGYVRWTQWIFCKLHEQGLAYEAEVPVNWCPELGTVLANEEVRDGKSDIGGHPVVRLPLKQWMLRITAYAERLLEDLDELDWPEHIKKMQRDWIGRSEGARVLFPVIDHADESIEVFTTRPDTLFGATYMVLAPEHPLVDKVTTPARRDAVKAYLEQTSRKSERVRIVEASAKTGVFTGAYATNPVNDAEIPIWIADYVLISYGTGAIMAVSGHDQRDYEFAKTFGLPIVEVVAGGDISREAFTGEGVNVNSEYLNGLSMPAAKRRMIEQLEADGSGGGAVSYKLRDWLFSRQRYWGEPFPVLHLEDGTTKLVPESDLPVELPELADYKPGSDFQPPLARVESWIETRDPDTGQSARRDPNTMPQWAGSCWYYLRFCDPRNTEAAWSPEAERYWMPVDLYVGGAEHAVLHLLYARFWHKVLYDLGLVSTKEPFQKLLNPGMIQARSYRYFVADGGDGSTTNGRFYASDQVRYDGETPVHRETGEGLRECWVPPDEVRWKDGQPLAPDEEIVLEEVTEKMSKSRGNVVNPDDVVAEYGADAMRLYEMFIGPLRKAAPWSTDGIPGVFRFLQRAYRLIVEEVDAEDRARELPPGEGTVAQQRLLARTIDKVTSDLGKLDLNTAISALMVFVRDIEKDGPVPQGVAAAFARLLAPFAPHLAEELWERLGHAESLAYASWPEADPALLVDEEIEIAVQVQGKLRARIHVPAEADEALVREVALNDANVRRHVGDREPRRVIYVPGRLLNLVL